jgi:hypothetical protein
MEASKYIRFSTILFPCGMDEGQMFPLSLRRILKAAKLTARASILRQ